ncbi:hypothetical protein CCP3SC5AM1_100026 [Gammaproteobacteria bacterium]
MTVAKIVSFVLYDYSKYLGDSDEQVLYFSPLDYSCTLAHGLCAGATAGG